VNWIRRSFGAKVLAALVGTVGLLLAITLITVRTQTNRQVRLVEDRTVQSAGELFEQMLDLQRRQSDQVTRPFVESPRAVALLDEAIESQDIDYLAGEASYEMIRSGLGADAALIVFTDDDGLPVISMLDDQLIPGDPADVQPLAMALLDSDSLLVMSAYRVLDERLYNMQVHFLELGSRAVGTLVFGLPIGSSQMDEIARVGAFETCLVIDGSCAATSAGVTSQMQASMISALDSDESVRTALSGVEWSINHQPLVSDAPAAGRTVVAIQLDEVRAPFENIQLTLLLTGLLALLLCGIAGVALSRSLTRPVLDLVTATGRVAKGDYETEVDVASDDEMGTLADAFNDMTRGLLLREQYRSVLNKVVSEDVAEELMRGDVELGGENRTITALFADIRGFTPMTVGMEPQEVIGLLNECMERLSNGVDAEGGVVDKYIGDEIMAVFGAPVAQEDHACRAVRAALRMRDGIAELNAERAERGKEPLGVGIGIASGIAVAGNMGSAERMNYTVLGETVNLAARLTDQAAAGEILISEQTEEWAVGGVLVAPCIGGRALKGFQAECLVYSVESFDESGTAES
jgi:adenylate cyclase